MQRSALRVILLLATLSLIGGLLPVSAMADESTPVASHEKEDPGPPPVVGTPVASSGDACDAAEFPVGEAGTSYQPLEDFGFAVPAEAPDRSLYLTVSTLLPKSCILFFHGLSGASTYLVLDGTIEFIAWAHTGDDPVVTAGNPNGATISVPLGAPVTLNEGDWVTVDREAVYAYRNPGKREARIVMATYERLGEQENGCAGGCRNHP